MQSFNSEITCDKNVVLHKLINKIKNNKCHYMHFTTTQRTTCEILNQLHNFMNEKESN